MDPKNTLELIRIFHKVVSEGKRPADPVEVNRIAMMAGYLVEPEACTEEVFEALKEALNNYKSTFYKDFEEVLSRTRLEQFVDQMLHYMSTYGTNYTGEVFTMNPEPEAMAYKELTPITAVSAGEMYRLCMEMISSGVALKVSTLKPLVCYIAEFLDKKENCELRERLDIPSIPNREAKAMLYSELCLTPDDPFEFLRTALYCATGSAMPINSSDSLKAILNGARNSLICLEMFGSELTAEQKQGLASIYFRFKNIFITFKKSFASISASSPKAAKGVSLINYLRHLAPRYKKPLRPDILSDVLDPGNGLEDLRSAIRSCSSAFRLVRILGYLKMTVARPTAVQYLIRNGKTYIRDLKRSEFEYNRTALRASELMPVFEEEIVSRLRRNVEGKSVRLPENIELTAPSSEKSFVGNFPFLSSYKVSSGVFIGVYWRNEWGTHDFDLSFISLSNGDKIGWNADFRDPQAEIIFSGDMTDADPEASEILFFRRAKKDGVVFVNRFNGLKDSKFLLFFGRGLPLIPGSPKPDPRERLTKSEDWTAGADFSINKMDIRLEAELTSETAQQMVGLIIDGRFYFLDLGIGESAVSSRSASYPLAEAMKARLHSAVPLRPLLEKAGAILHNPDSDKDPAIDLTERRLTRNTIITLFS